MKRDARRSWLPTYPLGYLRDRPRCRLVAWEDAVVFKHLNGFKCPFFRLPRFLWQGGEAAISLFKECFSA